MQDYLFNCKEKEFMCVMCLSVSIHLFVLLKLNLIRLHAYTDWQTYRRASRDTFMLSNGFF